MMAAWPVLKHFVTPCAIVVVVGYILFVSKEYRRLKQGNKNTEKIELRIGLAILVLFVVQLVMLTLT